jgi:hypothetical protein
MEKVNSILLEAVKQALAEPGEQRLFRSGKLPGLFASRNGAPGEAAARAVREGLLEVVRTELRGKTALEWVRGTPQAVEFVHNQESPLATLRELHAALQINQEALPAWLAQLEQRAANMLYQLSTEVQQMAHRLRVLGDRVEEALRRVEATQPRVGGSLAQAVPWAQEALGYLDCRRESGSGSPCALSELFLAIRIKHSELTIAGFHTGLRRLFDRGLVRLLPYEGVNGLPEPEYALLDGYVTYYFVTHPN